ncbi:MAG: replication initiation protein [Nitrososphaeria archaeon]
MNTVRINYDKLFCVPNCIIDAELEITGNVQKLFLALLSLINIKTDELTKKPHFEFRVPVAEFADLLKLFNIYAFMPKLVKSLQHIRVNISGHNYSVFSDVQYYKGILSVKFNSNFIKAAYSLHSCTEFKLREIQPLRFTHSPKIYMWLKEYSRHGSMTISVEQFRKLIGIAHKYLNGNFAGQILKKAQDELKNTLADFDFEFVKVDSRYDTIKFTLLSFANERRE